MKNKTLITTVASTLVTTLAVAGITYAATPASNNTTLLGQGTVEVDSIKVGNPNAGGVTFFNGTIVNESAPVTFGDDVRVDGRIWRGKNQGPGLGDNKPFIINDDAQVAGTFTVGGTDIFAAIDAKISKDSPEFDPQTGFISLSPSAFEPATFDSGGGILCSLSLLTGFCDTDVSPQTVIYPIDLPSGVTLSEMVLNASDKTASSSVNLYLMKRQGNIGVAPLTTLTPYIVASTGSGHAFSGGDTTQTTALSESINHDTNDYYIYELWVTFGEFNATNLAVISGSSDQALFNSARLKYTYTKAN